MGRTGATVTCVRPAPDATPHCMATDAVALETERSDFDGVSGAVTDREVSTGDDGTAIKVSAGARLMQGSATNDADARRYVGAYEAFVHDGARLRFEETIGPPLAAWGFPIALLLSLFFVGTLYVVDETTRIDLDLDEDRLTVGVARWLQKAPNASKTTTLDWTLLSEIAAVDPPGDEENVKQLVARSTNEKGEQRLCVVLDAQADDAAKKLNAWMATERERRRAEQAWRCPPPRRLSVGAT